MQTAMATEVEYRTRAKECIELAQLTRSSQERIMLQHIAETWVRLADEAARGGGFNAFAGGAVHDKS
jgi:hypothetical protein